MFQDQCKVCLVCKDFFIEQLFLVKMSISKCLLKIVYDGTSDCDELYSSK